MPIKLSDLQCFEITLGFMNFFVIYYLCQYTHAENSWKLVKSAKLHKKQTCLTANLNIYQYQIS